MSRQFSAAMKFEAPQVILLALMALGVGVHTKQQRNGRGFIGAALVLALLWWGGFFG